MCPAIRMAQSHHLKDEIIAQVHGPPFSHLPVLDQPGVRRVGGATPAGVDDPPARRLGHSLRNSTSQ